MSLTGFSSPEYQAALFERAPVGIAVVSKEGTFIAVNAKLTELLGYSHVEMESMSFHQITHPSDLNGDTEEVNRQLLSPTPEGYTMVKRYITKFGNVLWFTVTVRPVIEAGSIKHFISWIVPLPNHGKFAAEKDKESGEIIIRPSQTFLEIMYDTAKRNPVQFMLLLFILSILTGQNVMELLGTFFGLKLQQ